MWHLREFLWMVTLRPLNASEDIYSWVCVWHTRTHFPCWRLLDATVDRCVTTFLESRLPPQGWTVLFFLLCCQADCRGRSNYGRGKKLSAILDINMNFIFSVETRESAFEPNWLGCVTDWEGPKEFLSEKVRCVSNQRMIWEKQLEPGWLSSLGFLLLAPYPGLLLLWRGVMTTAALTNGST